MIDKLKQKIGINPWAWLHYTWRMRTMVRQFDSSRATKMSSLHFAVVITPWLGSGVPWFSLVVGLLLARNGNKVSFIIDDLPFGNRSLRYQTVIFCIRSVVRLMRANHTVVALSSVHAPAPLKATEGVEVERLAHLNSIWEMRGEAPSDDRANYAALCTTQLRRANGPISQLMQPGAVDVVFIPGGIYGSSGLWTRHAIAAKIRVASYDNGGFGALMLAVNGIACQMHDIPSAFQRLKTRCVDLAEHSFAVASALAEIERRRAGVDTFASQIIGGGSGDARYNGAILIALNSSWDSAALGLHTVFADNKQWIVETARYLLDNTSVPVIVRQHPAERLAYARSNDDYRGLLELNFGKHPRLHFIAADEKINSYDLFNRVRAVVVYTSTIGVEAAANSKPVITPSNSYYSGLDFVWRASTVTQYQKYLRDAAANILEVTPAMRDDALLCYYITQVCNWVFSSFNPADIRDWSQMSLQQLQEDTKIQGVIYALQNNVPIAFMNHLDRWEAHRKSLVNAAA